RYRQRVERFRYGPGVFKMDWALSEPIPWLDVECRRAATVHLGGDLEHVARSEALVHRGAVDPQPFVILVQPSLFDPSRAPPGRHTAWAYCHVPHGSDRDFSAELESVIERYAPGFKDVVLARRSFTAQQLERYNPNYVGGDIAGGMSDLAQLFFRPVAKLDPYATSAADIYLCSSSTPPGSGVHGMCGYWAAQSVLRRF
ncbi:MAG TPA: NAD(P)/FAD-dependent oxidoreductase, partial [Gemmatimonadales bacterium]